MPPKQKVLDQMAAFLGHPVVEAALVLPRDGYLWLMTQQASTKLLTQGVFKARPSPGGHVAGMPAPPNAPAWLVLTETEVLVLRAKAQFVRWVPKQVWAVFKFSQILGLWIEDAKPTTYREVHLTLTDGNYWEFSVGEIELKRFAEFAGKVLQAAGRQPGPRFLARDSFDSSPDATTR